jgi:hypothetical protein
MMSLSLAGGGCESSPSLAAFFALALGVSSVVFLSLVFGSVTPNLAFFEKISWYDFECVGDGG